MIKRVSNWGMLLFMAVSVAAVTPAACGGGNGTHVGGGGSSQGGGGGLTFVTGGGTSQSQSNGGPLDVTPSAPQTLAVGAGTPAPTVTFAATYAGESVTAVWSVDRGEVGSLSSSQGSSTTFTPTGTAGGVVTISASAHGKTVTRKVFVKVASTQSGSNGSAAEARQIPTDRTSLTAGGGVGGVGGEGLGEPVSDPTLKGLLTTPTDPATSAKLTFLYPYDKTVWPRGLLAPLLMWSSTLTDVKAIRIDLTTTSGSFSWTGTFGPPKILATTRGAFIRHPIPQDVWDAATNTAGGVDLNGNVDGLTVRLTVATATKSYGPISETWVVAPARLAGTVYYNSYGTRLVKNSNGPDANGQQYGAAVLGIRGGDTGPSVVAGNESLDGSGSGCRVCHVVSADGSRLLVQHGDGYNTTSAYDLKNGNAETVLTGLDGTLGWAGLSPDGNRALSNAADLAAGSAAMALYPLNPASTTALTATGIPADLQAGTPTFSPDGKHVAFDFMGGTIGATTGNGKQLVSLDFDAATQTFSNLRVLATMAANDDNKRAGFPSFFPTNDAVAFHYQIVASNHRYNTWRQATAQVYWSDLGTGTAVPLAALNGLSNDGKTSYLPTGPNNHTNDTVLNYEPTVNPIVSGGYAWVVFTSRRLYGNLATTEPWQSDPRNYDYTDYTLTTCKKLWVAAVDVGSLKDGKFSAGVTPGTDPSHPAFYLPAQELVAGNARGFWVLDPCRADGQSCSTGDQCCNGFCRAGGDAGGLVCGQPVTGGCSGLQERCSTAADCCDSGALCLNGFCAIASPPPPR